MKNIKLKDLVMMALMLAFMVVASKISIPIGVIPLTLQTFAVFIISLVLGKKSCIIFILYLLIGLTGLPVFSTCGGIEYIYMPSFGFIIGFIPASFIIGISSNKEKFYIKYILSIIGLLIINVFGVAYMYFIFKYHMGAEKDIIYILNVGVVPFIAKDIFTAILSCIIYSRIRVLINKESNQNVIFEEQEVLK